MLPITVCCTLGVTLVLSLTSNLVLFSKWPVVTSLCGFFTLIYDRYKKTDTIFKKECYMSITNVYYK